MFVGRIKHTSEKIKLVEQIVEQVDTVAAEGDGTDATEASQFMAHKVATADSQAVLRVLQTLFVGDPSIRMEIDAHDTDSNESGQSID